MTEKAQKKSINNPALDALSHNRDLLLGLSRAAQSIQQARTVEEIHRAVGIQIKSLGGEVTLFMLSEDRQSLIPVYMSYARSLLRKFEKATGSSAQGYQIALSPDSVYTRGVVVNKTEYFQSAKEHFYEASPIELRPVAAQFINIMKIEQGILAPLHVAGETMGLMMISGLALTEEDVPAMESFAGQIAAGLQNARLMQKLQDELSVRKQVAAALQASEAKIHALLDAIPDMIFMLDYEGKFLDYHAPKAQRLYARPESFLGKNIRDVMPPAIVEIYESRFELVMQSGESQLFEYTLDLEDGQHYFEAHIVASQHEHILVIVRNISRRKNAEEAARQAERHFKALIENAPDGIALIGMDGRIRYASPSTKSMFNYESEDGIEANPMKFVHPDENAIVLNTLDKLMRDPAYIPTIQYRYKHKNGSYRWVESTFTNLMAEPSVQAIVINFRDVTERKQAEDELRFLNTSLSSAHRDLQQMFASERVLARTDGLTGQYNRRYFFEIATREFMLSIRYTRPLTIILFDIDGFKQVNDNFGHALGDRLLLQVAEATALHVRDVDVLARYGGDEFIILLPQTNAQQAFLLAERVREAVAATRMESENSPFAVTLSVGIAEIITAPQDKLIEDVIRRADQALYEAKKKGRNHTVIYTEP